MTTCWLHALITFCLQGFLPSLSPDTWSWGLLIEKRPYAWISEKSFFWKLEENDDSVKLVWVCKELWSLNLKVSTSLSNVCNFNERSSSFVIYFNGIIYFRRSTLAYLASIYCTGHKSFLAFPLKESLSKTKSHHELITFRTTVSSLFFRDGAGKKLPFYLFLFCYFCSFQLSTWKEWRNKAPWLFNLLLIAGRTKKNRYSRWTQISLKSQRSAFPAYT